MSDDATGVVDEWVSWAGDDPEPAGVSVVRDSSGIVSYDDSPEWQRQVVPGGWAGFKGGEKVSLSWAELLEVWGPVTGWRRVRVAA
jgi:hypothetical protein